jgi:LemA protein
MSLNLLIGTGAIIGIAVAVVVVLLLIVIIAWYISTRNSFVQLDNTCEEAFASIDVYLKKRYDLIPNLVETVKGYAKHESQTLEKVIAARNNAASANTTAEKIEANANLSNAIRSFNVVAERYPELKANTNFMDLSNQLKNIESELEKSRRYYNGTVKTFNTKIMVFPASIVANGMHLTKKKYFELDSAEERQNVKVSF